jgi:predicted dehydrogenase
MAPFRVGIVGCGNIADNHYRSFSSIPGTQVLAVADVDLDRARAFAGQRSILHAVPSLAEMLKLGLDAVTICTPHPTHEALVIQAAENGANVLCEKPIAVTTESALRMIHAAEEGGITFGAVFQRRYWPAAQNIRAAIDDGRLGTPMLAHCQVLLHRGEDYYNAAAWRGTWAADGGGVLMTQAIHNIDLLQWFMGNPVEVSAKAGTFTHGALMEVEDTAAALITFASGAVATLSATVSARPNLGTRLVLTGTSGRTVALTEIPEGADAANDIWTVPGDAYAPAVPAGPDAEFTVAEVNARLMPLHRQQVEDFVDAVRSNRAPLVTGHEALKSLQIVEAVYASARTGAPVRIADLGPSPALRHLDTLAASH